MSTGRQHPLWASLASPDFPPALVVAGELDAKFVRIGARFIWRYHIITLSARFVRARVRCVCELVTDVFVCV